MRFEYKVVCLTRGVDGIESTENRLNSWAVQGWRLLPMILEPGWGLMEREVRE